MKTSKKIPEILLRAAAGGVILACGLYFVFGLAAITASYQPGTAIQHYEPVTVQMLWHEVTKTPFEEVGRWVWLNSGCRAGIVTLGLWFLATFGVALALVGKPRFFVRSRRALILASWIVALGTLFGGWGLFTFMFTLLNAFALRGLDGEWIIELYPAFDAAGILYLAAVLLLRRAWALRRAGRASSETVQEATA